MPGQTPHIDTQPLSDDHKTQLSDLLLKLNLLLIPFILVDKSDPQNVQYHKFALNDGFYVKYDKYGESELFNAGKKVNDDDNLVQRALDSPHVIGNNPAALQENGKGHVIFSNAVELRSDAEGQKDLTLYLHFLEDGFQLDVSRGVDVQKRKVLSAKYTKDGVILTPYNEKGQEMDTITLELQGRHKDMPSLKRKKGVEPSTQLITDIEGAIGVIETCRSLYQEVQEQPVESAQTTQLSDGGRWAEPSGSVTDNLVPLRSVRTVVSDTRTLRRGGYASFLGATGAGKFVANILGRNSTRVDPNESQHLLQ